MNIDEVRSMISDLVDVEPKTFGTDKDAAEAAQWIDIEKKTEGEIDAILDPAIKQAYSTHRKLTGEKKTFLEKLAAAKDRVRVNLANWIAGGHDVDGCYIKVSWKVTVVDPDAVPDDYAYRAIDEKKLQEWVRTTEGQVAVPGCQIDRVNILYSREA